MTPKPYVFSLSRALRGDRARPRTDPHVRHLNARGKALMSVQAPQSIYGHSPLGTFYQPDRKGPAEEAVSLRKCERRLQHAVGAIEQDARGVTITFSAPGPLNVRASTSSPATGNGGIRKLGVSSWVRLVELAGRGRDRKTIASRITFTCDWVAHGRAAGGRGGFVRIHAAARRNEEQLKSDDTFAPSSREAVSCFRNRTQAFTMPASRRWRVGRISRRRRRALMPPFAGRG